MMDCLTSFFTRFWRSRKYNYRDVPCDISQGVGNNQTTFNGVQLEDSMVKLQVTIKDDCASDGTVGASCSSGSNSDVDENDGEKFSCVEKKGVKVNHVKLGSFAHGFGLRENDIIRTVNDIPVDSAQMVKVRVNKTFEINKNSRLTMEIQRIEKGYIKLDNQGDEISVDEIDGPVICVSCDHGQQEKYRLKNLNYRKFLTVKNENIRLSTFGTNKCKTYFVVYNYVKRSGPSAGDRLIVLKHEASGKCLYVENKSELILKDPPQKELPENSAFLFNMKSVTNSDYALPIVFETIASPNMAIGFKKPKKKAELLHESETDNKILFNLFVVRY